MVYNNTNNSSVTIRQMTEDDLLYKSIENDLLTLNVEAKTLRNLLFGQDTQCSSPRLLAITVEDQWVGYVITCDFFQATYITCLQIKEAYRRQGYGSLLLRHVCSNPERTYLLLTEVALSDSEQLATCVHRKIFYIKNGFRSVPIKWPTAFHYQYDVHIKSPDQELGSLLAALRKGREVWNTALTCRFSPAAMPT